jgi:hypothetical protein
MTFEEMRKARDPLYAALQPNEEFALLKDFDRFALVGVTPQWRRFYQLRRDQLTREIQYFVNGKRRNRRHSIHP